MFKSSNLQAGEIAKWLRAFTVVSEDPGFNSQNPCGSSELLITLVPGDPVPFSGLFAYQAHTWCTYIDAGNQKKEFKKLVII